jgi:phytanoyl-CoA hydroxylase
MSTPGTLEPVAATQSARHPYALNAEQLAAFKENGYLHMHGVLEPQELEAVRAAETRVTAPALVLPLKSPDYKYHRDPQSGRPVLFRVEHLQSKDPVFMKLHGNPRILAAMQSIFGPDFLPCSFNMVFKAPGYGPSVPWHRDPAYCRIDHGINAGIYLDDANEDNGMLYVVPGSHARAEFELQEAIDTSGFHLPGAIPVPAKAGDIVIHSENVLHGSQTVRSQRERRVIYYGARSIREQLSRGLDTNWARSVGRIAKYTTRLRSRSPEFTHEIPFNWHPDREDCRVEINENEYVEFRLME